MENTVGQKRSRDDSGEPELVPESPEAKKIRTDVLLDILDDDDAEADCDPADELATVMKSFEEEIAFPSPPRQPVPEHPVVEVEEEGLQSLPRYDLGYLLEASDDELGLPPTSAPSSEDGAETEAKAAALAAAAADGALGQIWGFEDDIGLGFGPEFGIRPEMVGPEEGDVFDGGLFDYPDVFYAPSDLSELSWRSETLPAV